MASFDGNQALPEVLSGLFKAYSLSRGSLASFMALAPVSTHRSRNGQFQVRSTTFGYDQQRGNVGKVSDGAGRGIAVVDYTDVNFTMEQFATDWHYVDDRVAEALGAENPDLDAFAEAIEQAESAMTGFLHEHLHTAIDALSAYGTALDLTDSTTRLSQFLAGASDAQALETAPRFRPNVFAFGPTAYRLLLNLDEVREAASNMGGVYPTKGTPDASPFYSGAALEVAPALVEVCRRVGVRPVLIDEAKISAAGTKSFIFTTKGFLGYAAPGRAPSCLKTFSPYDGLVDVIQDRIAPPAMPGDAYCVRSELKLETVDTNLGKEITLTLS